MTIFNAYSLNNWVLTSRLGGGTGGSPAASLTAFISSSSFKTRASWLGSLPPPPGLTSQFCHEHEQTFQNKLLSQIWNTLAQDRRPFCFSYILNEFVPWFSIPLTTHFLLRQKLILLIVYHVATHCNSHKTWQLRTKVCFVFAHFEWNFVIY